MTPMNFDFAALGVFVFSFLVSAFAGLAAMLRSGVEVNRKTIFAATLNSGMLGLGIALLWYNVYQERIFFLVGLCLLSGLGGNTTIDFVISLVKRMVVGFSLKPPTNTDKIDMTDNEDQKDVQK